jgi:hypothetical protein
VELVIVATLVMTVPFVAPPFTAKASAKLAVPFAGNDARVQVMVPLLLPADGVVQEKAGPEFCASETKVVLPGTEVVNTTFCASSGPLLVRSTR